MTELCHPCLTKDGLTVTNSVPYHYGRCASCKFFMFVTNVEDKNDSESGGHDDRYPLPPRLRRETEE